YIQNKDLGFNKEHVVIVENTWVLRDKAHLLKKEMVQREDVLAGSVTNYLPVNSNRSSNAYWLKEEANQNKEVLISRFTVDFDYVKTYGLEIVEGRNLSVEFPTDSQAVLINEVAAMQLGIADNPIGREISSVGDMDENGNPTFDNFKIVGILKDFHFSNAKELINPLGLFIGNNRGAVSFRIKSDGLQATLADMEAAYKKFAPDKPFQYSFVDERFEEMYETEQRLGRIFGSFSILAIFIACLGLFALATFMAERRAKEISIRRVMGARVSNIMLLLSSEFLKLVGLALIFAVPVSYYLMQNWLEGFAYRVDLGVDVFVTSGILALMIAQLTVSFQSMKAALANPVNALRNE
ncbi:MAG: FtsX-like permease family protein, partial [Bacteroidota bacterium]